MDTENLQQQNEKEQTEILSSAINTGLKHFSNPELMVSSTEVEDISNLKQLFRLILEGKLILASPDRLKPEEAN